MQDAGRRTRELQLELELELEIQMELDHLYIDGDRHMPDVSCRGPNESRRNGTHAEKESHLN